MNNSTLYLIVAAVVVVLVILILVIWSMRQLRGANHSQKARGKKEKQKSHIEQKNATNDSESLTTGEVADEATMIEEVDMPLAPSEVEEVRDDLNEQISSMPQPAESIEEGSPTEEVEVTPAWISDVAPEQEPPFVWEDLDAMGADFHLNEDHVVRLSAYEAPKKAEDDEDLAEDAEDADGIIVEENEAQVEQILNTVPSELEESAIQVPVEDRRQWLQKQLDLPSVLGWFSMTPEGEAKYSDQVYDPEVYRHFAKLLDQMIASAELVGMADWKEFVVHGAEGVILMVAAPQSIMAKGDYIVVFLDEEQSVSRVIAQIRQVS